MKKPKEVILDALQQYKGHNLEKAEKAFRNLSSDELDKEYGQTGKTCRQILDSYKHRRDEVENAILWVDALLI